MLRMSNVECDSFVVTLNLVTLLFVSLLKIAHSKYLCSPSCSFVTSNISPAIGIPKRIELRYCGHCTTSRWLLSSFADTHQLCSLMLHSERPLYSSMYSRISSPTHSSFSSSLLWVLLNYEITTGIVDRNTSPSILYTSYVVLLQLLTNFNGVFIAFSIS